MSSHSGKFILLAICIVGLVVGGKFWLLRSHFGKEMFAPFLFEPLRSAKTHLHDFERLTNEESVGQAFSRLGHPGSYQITPEATSVLKKIIENDELLVYRRYAIALFALGGEAEDVPYLLTQIEANRNKIVNIHDKSAIRATILVLAYLAIRDVKDAKVKLRSMCSRAYWEDLSIRWTEQLSPEQQVDDFVVSAIQYYAVTEPDDLEIVVASALRDAPEGQRREDMRFQLNLPQLRALSKEWELKVYRIIPPSTRQCAQLNFNGDLNSPMPRILEKVRSANAEE